MARELGCLSQGCREKDGTYTAGTNTIKFLYTLAEINAIPCDHTAIYARIVVDDQPQKAVQNCVCLTVGGSLINWPGELTTNIADFIANKIYWNSVLSIKRSSVHVHQFQEFLFENTAGSM